MKKYIKNIFFLTLLAVGACKQDVIKFDPPVTPPTPETPTKGSANFTKFVAIGNSLAAGYQAGALFNEGQANSLPSILAKQFQTVGGSTTFNQPDINSVNGYNSAYSIPGVLTLGRLILFTADGISSHALPTPAGYPGVPAPYNTGDLPGPYAGVKANLNNFGVPGILLGQILTPLTGGPSTSNSAYNALYARFASNPGTSTIIGDAIAAQPTFFMFELGNNDVLGYATSGASGAIPLTDAVAFQGQYTTAINLLLNSNTNLKGVVGNIPDVTSIPFFFTVLYNAIPLDVTTATVVNSGFAGYNQVLDIIAGNPTLLSNFGLTSADLNARKVSFSAASNNRILIADETLKDLGPVLDYLLTNSLITSSQRSALMPYQQVRQATATDLITLTAGAVLGTTVGGNPLLVNGVSVPLADKYVLLPSETQEILTRTAAFNAAIKTVVDASQDRVALADIHASFNSLITTKVIVTDGVTISPTFAPPTGAFSEDGVHPNSRGYAYLANIFIDAINAKFGATIPKASLANYKGVGLPVHP